jgi:16S rRNA (cytosine1402-N4)-methyltransferase
VTPQGHVPVLLEKVLKVLEPAEGETIADGTIGLGGHALPLLRKVGRTGALVGLDRDPSMLERAAMRLREEGFDGEEPKVTLMATSYENIAQGLERAGRPGADVALLDLGVNSCHLDDASRGFTFREDGPLDGRFNPAEPGTRSIADLANHATAAELALWISRYGEERYAHRIAAAIVAAREGSPITRTVQLAEIIRSAYPARERHTGRIDPATRTMQALRIVANDELGHVERGVKAMMAALNPGGRLAVISFHRLEDRLAKRLFDAAAAPREMPGNLYRAASTEGLEFELDRRGALMPDEAEIAANPRCRSARLRVIRRRGGRRP